MESGSNSFHEKMMSRWINCLSYARFVHFMHRRRGFYSFVHRESTDCDGVIHDFETVSFIFRMSCWMVGSRVGSVFVRSSIF